MQSLQPEFLSSFSRDPSNDDKPAYLRDLSLGLLAIPAPSDEEAAEISTCIDVIFYNIDAICQGHDEQAAQEQMRMVADIAAKRWPMLQSVFCAIGAQIDAASKNLQNPK